MRIEAVNNYQTDENTYIVFENDKAVVIDPGSEADAVIKKAKELKAEIEYILITHCHYDHITGLEDLRKITGAKLVSGSRASENIQKPEINLSAFTLPYTIKAKPSDIIMSDGESLILCDMKFECIYTPGHTDCGVCYKTGGALFSGDTLFLRNVGRSDLPTGNAAVLEKSIREKLYTLPDDTSVYPGHGAPTSIGYEKSFNFFVSE